MQRWIPRWYNKDCSVFLVEEYKLETAESWFLLITFWKVEQHYCHYAVPWLNGGKVTRKILEQWGGGTFAFFCTLQCVLHLSVTPTNPSQTETVHYQDGIAGAQNSSASYQILFTDSINDAVIENLPNDFRNLLPSQIISMWWMNGNVTARNLLLATSHGNFFLISASICIFAQRRLDF